MRKGRQRIIRMDELDDRIYALEQRVVRWAIRHFRDQQKYPRCGTVQDAVETLERLTVIRDLRDESDFCDWSRDE